MEICQVLGMLVHSGACKMQICTNQFTHFSSNHIGKCHWQMPLLIFLSLSLPPFPPPLTGPRYPPRKMTCWLTSLCSQNVHDKIKVIIVPAGQNQVFSIKNDHNNKSVEFETCLYVNGSCQWLFDQLLACYLWRLNSRLLQ